MGGPRHGGVLFPSNRWHPVRRTAAVQARGPEPILELATGFEPATR